MKKILIERIGMIFSRSRNLALTTQNKVTTSYFYTNVVKPTGEYINLLIESFSVTKDWKTSFLDLKELCGGFQNLCKKFVSYSINFIHNLGSQKNQDCEPAKIVEEKANNEDLDSVNKDKDQDNNNNSNSSAPKQVEESTINPIFLKMSQYFKYIFSIGVALKIISLSFFTGGKILTKYKHSQKIKEDLNKKIHPTNKKLDEIELDFKNLKTQKDIIKNKFDKGEIEAPIKKAITTKFLTKYNESSEVIDNLKKYYKHKKKDDKEAIKESIRSFEKDPSQHSQQIKDVENLIKEAQHVAQKVSSDTAYYGDGIMGCVYDISGKDIQEFIVKHLC
jgi:hypothetical protein